MAPEKIIIKFTKDYTVQDERVGTDEEERYLAGQRRAMTMASAEHFINRGVATRLSQKVKGTAS